MRKNSIKNTRINGEVQRELSRIISREIKDPRIAPMTSVVDAVVTSDLKQCKAYISVLGNDEEKEETKVLYKTSKIYDIKEETKSESSLTKPFTMLLIGVDSSNDGVTSGYNADVLILATFNPKTLRATMTSVPRDMYLKTLC